MLVNIRKKSMEPFMALILGVIGNGRQERNPEPGIYISGHWSFGDQITDPYEDWSDFGELGSYGVCDSIEQVKERYAQWLEAPDKKYYISFVKITKEDEPNEGGWRWHKWGEYIGTKEPQCEYIYDEGPEIEYVYTYHIYQLK